MTATACGLVMLVAVAALALGLNRMWGHEPYGLVAPSAVSRGWYVCRRRTRRRRLPPESAPSGEPGPPESS